MNELAAVRQPKARRGIRIIIRAISILEYAAVMAAGTVFGVSSVIRYLRNPNPSVTVRVLRALGATIGDRTTIKGSLFIDNAEGNANSTGDLSHLKIGNNCYIGDGVFVDLAHEVVIEDNAVIAGRCSFLTHSECGRSPYLNQRFPRKCEPVRIGSGAWIGFGATILAGVSVGQNTVVGANSLVIEDAEHNYVYVGTPAKKRNQLS